MTCRQPGGGQTSSLDTLTVRDRACHLYESFPDQLQILAAALRDGLAAGDICLCLLDAGTAINLEERLLGEGVDLRAASAAGNLIGWHDPHLSATFDVSARLARAEDLLAAALAKAGRQHPSLRFLYEISYLFGKEFVLPEFLAFQEKVGKSLDGRAALSLCQIDRRNVSGAMLSELVRHHSALLHRGRVHRQPPEPDTLVSGDCVQGAEECTLSPEIPLRHFFGGESCCRILAELSSDAILIHTRGRVVFANSAASDLFGAAHPCDLLYQCIHDLSAPMEERPVRQLYPERGGAMVYEEDALRLNGERFVAEVRRLPLGDSRTVLVLYRDISERRRTERILRQSLAEAELARDQIDGILQSVEDGVIVTDNQNRALVMNRAAEKILGVHQVQVRGRELVGAIRNRKLREQFRIFSWQWEIPSQTVEFRIPDHRSRHPRVLQARFSILHSRKGKRSGVVTILRDVTLPKEFERLKNEWISMAAHELRTPLTTVLGFTELLLRHQGEMSPEQRLEWLEEVYGNAENLRQLVDSLVEISRIESGQALPLDRERASLGSLLRRTVEDLRSKAADYNLILDLADPDEDIWLDLRKIEQVVVNLISNAVKYSPPEKDIRIVSQRTPGGFLVSVRDEGVGMTAEQKRKVFDTFYRADSSNTAIGGVGLGMSIAKYIVEAHGGTIWVCSAPEQGTTVSFTLPAARRGDPPEGRSPGS